MKQRMISVAVGLAVLAAVCLLYSTWFAVAAFILIGGLAIYEGLRAFSLHNRMGFLAVYLATHVLNLLLLPDALYVVFALLFATFCLAMRGKEKVEFKRAAAAYAVALMVTLGCSAVLRLRALFPIPSDQLFSLAVCLSLGWVCDTFAFIFGSLLGKRKMSPAISPHKTWAGAISGVVGTTIWITALFWAYTTYWPGTALFGANRPVHLLFYAAMGTLGAIVGIIGDLSASFIKRECGLKDFGNIMPGHGGALDRLDSVLFTSVFALAAFQFMQYLFGVGSHYIVICYG